jgi:hypothetical protein
MISVVPPNASPAGNTFSVLGSASVRLEIRISDWLIFTPWDDQTIQWTLASPKPLPTTSKKPYVANG